MEHGKGIVASNKIKESKIPRIDKKIIDSYILLPDRDRAGVVARAMDKLGLVSSTSSERLKALIPKSSIVGQGITVRNIPEYEGPYKRWESNKITNLGEREAYFIAEAGDVIIIDGSSVFPASCLGSMSAKLAKHLGLAGIIVNGYVTGMNGIIDNDLPVWAIAGTTKTGHQRVETIEINGPIGIEGMRIEPGDLIVADESGIASVPYDLVNEILVTANKLIKNGSKVKESLENNLDKNIIKKELISQMENMVN